MGGGGGHNNRSRAQAFGGRAADLALVQLVGG
jgi:hypothetical protein